VTRLSTMTFFTLTRVIAGFSYPSFMSLVPHCQFITLSYATLKKGDSGNKRSACNVKRRCPKKSKPSPSLTIFLSASLFVPILSITEENLPTLNELCHLILYRNKQTSLIIIGKVWSTFLKIFRYLKSLRTLVLFRPIAIDV
jgi:hypothetical protein